jgi:predicted small secreted protein
MKNNYYRITFIILSAACVAFSSTSCRTIQGAGQDVEHAGQHLEKAAR